MFSKLGLHWASSVPAFLAVACLPFPFLFYRYGESIRLRCKFASEAAEALRKMRTRADDEDDRPVEIEGKSDHPHGHAGGMFSGSSSVSSMDDEEEAAPRAGDEEKKREDEQ
jgi:hypothetical protein